LDTFLSKCFVIPLFNAALFFDLFVGLPTIFDCSDIFESQLVTAQLYGKLSLPFLSQTVTALFYQLQTLIVLFYIHCG
jgi:hypothetical protein